jgi:tetratricopeptide (TPR) repeat protein
MHAGQSRHCGLAKLDGLRRSFAGRRDVVFVARAVVLLAALGSAGCDFSIGFGSELQSVPLPEMSRSDESVRLQIHEQHAAAAAAQTAGTPPSELANTYGRLGILLHAAEYFDAAEPAYVNARVLAADDPRWPYYLGHLYRRTGRAAQSLAAFSRALELRREDVPTLVWLARTHLEASQPEQAEPLLERAHAQAPRAAAVLAARGQLALARGDHAGASLLLEDALTVDRRALSLHAPLAAAYRALGQIQKAEVHAAAWKDADVPLDDPLMTDLATALRSAVSYEVRGVRALDRGDWAAAAATFRVGLNLARPQSPIGRSLRHKLGLALYLGGDLQEALRQFEEAVRLAPPGGHDEPASRVHYSLGIIMASSGRGDRAVEHLTRAVAFDEASLQARPALADALRRDGRAAASLPHYQETIRLDPQAADARLGYALALVRLGRWVEARRSLEEAVRAQPDRSALAHALARVLAAAPDPAARDGNRAAQIVDELFKASKRIEVGETMAMTLAELGDYAKAAAIQRGVLDAAQRAGLADDVRRMTANLRLYEQGRPCRMPWPDDHPIHRPGPPVTPQLAALLGE